MVLYFLNGFYLQFTTIYVNNNSTDVVTLYFNLSLTYFKSD